MSGYNFLIAFSGLLLSFILAIGFAGLFKYYQRVDMHSGKKRSAHLRPTSRLGGVAVCVAILFIIFMSNENWHLQIAISALPIFIAGLLEDIGRPLKPGIRLAVGVLCAAMFIYFKRHYITDVGIEWGNVILSVTPIAIAFTIFCIVSLINALNFIDGINGLASGKTMIASFALMWLSNIYNEPNLTLLGTAIFSASLGLFMLNYPHGRIFLGDAGAYTLGFLLAVSLITIHSKHPEISAWSVLLIIFWPIADMGHSIFRRRRHRLRPDRADYLHIHHVLMRGLIIFSDGLFSKEVANPLATAIILPIAALPVVLGVIFNDQNTLCMVLFWGFVVFFMVMHGAIIIAARRRLFRFGRTIKAILPK